MEGFNWELNSYEYYCCHEDPDYSDTDSKQDDDGDSGRRPDVFCGGRDCNILRNYPESSFEIDDDCISACALNSSCDSSSDSCASLIFANPNMADVSDVVFVVKCSSVEGKGKAPSCVEERREKVPSCTEVAGPKSDEAVPKGGVPVLVRKNGVRHRPHRRESDRATENEPNAIDEEMLEESKQSGFTDKSERKPSEGEYVNPCDMSTHL